MAGIPPRQVPVLSRRRARPSSFGTGAFCCPEFAWRAGYLPTSCSRGSSTRRCRASFSQVDLPSTSSRSLFGQIGEMLQTLVNSIVNQFSKGRELLPGFPNGRKPGDVRLVSVKRIIEGVPDAVFVLVNPRGPVLTRCELASIRFDQSVDKSANQLERLSVKLPNLIRELIYRRPCVRHGSQAPYERRELSRSCLDWISHRGAELFKSDRTGLILCVQALNLVPICPSVTSIPDGENGIENANQKAKGANDGEQPKPPIGLRRGYGRLNQASAIPRLVLTRSMPRKTCSMMAVEAWKR